MGASETCGLYSRVRILQPSITFTSLRVSTRPFVETHDEDDEDGDAWHHDHGVWDGEVEPEGEAEVWCTMSSSIGDGRSFFIVSSSFSC